MRSGRVSGSRWRGPRASGRGPRLARPAARRAARRRRPERLLSTLGSRGSHGPAGSVEAGGSCRAARGTRRARVAGNVDQATRRIHARRVQHPSPLPARPLIGRRPAPVTGGAAARPPGPGERENQQGHQSHREACHAQSHAQAGDMTTGVPGARVGAGRARHHQNPARHDHHGADHREGNDKPHPPGRGGIGAHRSTIASQYAPRKPYGQARPLRLAFRRSPQGIRAGRGRPLRYADDTLGP
jgi:hypothetical protein